MALARSADAMPTPQAQQPSVVEQNRLVSPKDAVNGADWLKAQGVQTGLDQLDLGADSKGKPIKFQISLDGAGVQIELTGSALDNQLSGDKTNGGLMGKLKKKKNDAKGASGLSVTDLLALNSQPMIRRVKAAWKERVWATASAAFLS